MAGGNLSPRQKMINMMYLVLTAMLALNVSAEILKAFHKVEVSMDRAGVNVNSKNVNTLKTISDYHSKNAGDAIGTDVYNKANQCKKIADEGVKYVSDLKNLLIENAEGRKEKDPNGELEKPDNIELHANYLIIQGNGAKLKLKIDETKSKLLALVPAKEKNNIKSDLSTEVEKGTTQSWESEEFEHTPLAAVVALLSKTENDIKNTEAQVLDALQRQLTNDVVIVSNFTPKVIPNNGTYITVGSEYSADIFLAASTRQEADIKVSNANIPVEDGVGKYKVIASGEGERKYSGVITTRRSNGDILPYPFEGSYFVLKPLAVISATKMNMVYIGLDNPISVSVPGYSANDISVTCTAGGKLVPDKQKGNFLLKVDGTNREVTLTASVKGHDGKVKKMGDQKYRVRQVPKPTPMLGAIKESRDVSVAELKTASFVYANLENFAFEGMSYTVTKYTIVFQPKRGDAVVKYANGYNVSPDIKSLFNGAKSGDRIILGNISATGPAGGTMVPTSLALTVK
jgi:gliding motility-associated protein GldM